MSAKIARDQFRDQSWNQKVIKQRFSPSGGFHDNARCCARAILNTATQIQHIFALKGTRYNNPLEQKFHYRNKLIAYFMKQKSLKFMES